MPIRAASPTEYPALRSLLTLAYEPVLAQLSADDAAGFLANIVAGVDKFAAQGSWFVAEEDGQLVGCVAFFAPFSTQHPLFQGNRSHVQLLGVSPAQSRRGVGRALMLRCLSESRKTGAENIALQTSEYMPAARRLYEALGFAIERELAPYFGKPTYLYVRSEG